MINYQKIIANDPGGDIDTALDAMRAMTEQRSKGVHRQSYVSIANEVDYHTATELEARVRTLVAAELMPDWVHHALKTNGLDVNNPQTQAQLDAIVGGGFTQDMADAIKATGSEEVLIFPRLKKGWLEQARAKAGGA